MHLSAGRDDENIGDYGEGKGTDTPTHCKSNFLIEVEVTAGKSHNGGAVTEKMVNNVGPTKQEGESVGGVEADIESSAQPRHNDKLCTELSAHNDTIKKRLVEG